MNLLIFLVLLLFIIIGTFLGYKRGIIWSGIRIGLLFVATLVAIALSESIAEKLLVKFLGDGSSERITQVFAQFFANSDISQLSQLSVPLSGLALSIATPITFAMLFVIGGLISLLLYLIIKFIIKKICGANILRNVPLSHKIIGAIVNGIVAIYAFSLIISPAYVPVQIIDETGRVDQLFKITRDILELKENASPSPLGNTGIINKVNDAEKIYSTILHTPISDITKITLANSFSRGIYENISVIPREYLTTTGNLPEEYSLEALINELMPLVSDTDDFLDTIKSNKPLSVPVIDSSVVIFKKTSELQFLSSDEKLLIVNFITDKINDKIDQLILEAYIGRLEHYTSFESFVSDMNNYISLLRTIAELDLF